MQCLQETMCYTNMHHSSKEAVRNCQHAQHVQLESLELPKNYPVMCWRFDWASTPYTNFVGNIYNIPLVFDKKLTGKFQLNSWL